MQGQNCPAPAAAWPSIMGVTARHSKAYWDLCIWSEPTITAQNAKADSARAIVLCGWNCIPSHLEFCG